MHIAERLIQHRAEILALATKHGAENLRVFGSVANGTETEASDLDLLVSLAAIRSPFFPGGLKADLESLLNCDVDIVTEHGLHRMIRDQILREAKLL